MNPWQTAGIQINAWDSAPPEYLAPLRKAGYTRIELLLNMLVEGLAPPPRSYVDALKRPISEGGAGFDAVYGVVWADSFEWPQPLEQFVLDESRRLNLNGIIINAEDGTEARDQEGLEWSKRFCKWFREDFPRLPLALNTYIGCGGIDLAAWERANARLLCQTHHEGQTFEWGCVGYQAWAKKYAWTNPAKVKPQFGVYKSADGTRADVTAQVASAKAAGMCGFSAYYGEGTFDEPEHMVRLIDEARKAGVVK